MATRATFSRHRIVRRHDADRFRQDYRFSVTHRASQSHISAENDWSLHVPELADAWASCKTLPTLHTIARSGQGLFYLGGEKLTTWRCNDQSQTISPGRKGIADGGRSPVARTAA